MTFIYQPQWPIWFLNKIWSYQHPEPGVDYKSITFGMTVPLSGANKEIGQAILRGIDIRFKEENDKGGVSGRRLFLNVLDDENSPQRAFEKVERLNMEGSIFAILGGAFSSIAETLYYSCMKHNILYFGAFATTSMLRKTPPDSNIFVWRAGSIEQSTAIKNFIIKNGIDLNKIAIITPNDATGDSLYGTLQQNISSINQHPHHIQRFIHDPIFLDMHDMIQSILKNKHNIDFIILGTTYRFSSIIVENLWKNNYYPMLITTTLSFADLLANDLHFKFKEWPNSIYTTTASPDYLDKSDISHAYLQALHNYRPGVNPDFLAYEAYLTADMLIQGLKHTGLRISKENLVASLEQTHQRMPSIEPEPYFNHQKHQASSYIGIIEYTPDHVHRFIH